MSKMAVLVSVHNRVKVRAKLPRWTAENPDEIIADVLKGKPRDINNFDADGCKADLEKDGAAEVKIR